MDVLARYREFIDVIRETLRTSADEESATRQLWAPMRTLIETPDLLAPFGLPRPNEGGAYLLHHDELGFLLRAQVVPVGRRVPPHDHGPYWAVYGGYVGTTAIRTWCRTDDRRAEGKAHLLPVTEFLARPGEVSTFRAGTIHQPNNAGDEPAIFITVYNGDLSTAERYSYDPEQGSAKLARQSGLQDRPDHVDLTHVLRGEN